MKHLTSATIVFFLCLFVYTKFAGPIPFSMNSFVTTKTDTFSVTGEGKATAIPDIAVVSVGVEAQGSTVALAQQQLNTKMNNVIDAVKKAGIASADVQTTNYNISPQYNYQQPTQQITGYQASEDLTVKVRAMDKTNTVIDAATTNGANQVGGVAFDVSDKTKAQDQARQQAIDEAKKKATTAAAAGGFTLGRIVNYSEDFGNTPRPVMFANDVTAGGAAPKTAPTQVEPGSNEMTVDVSLSYEIR